MYEKSILWSPELRLPHLANSCWSSQSLFSPSTLTFTALACLLSISMKFPIGSVDDMYWLVCMFAVFPTMSIVVLALIISVAAKTDGSNISSNNSCFMLFHVWQIRYIKVCAQIS